LGIKAEITILSFIAGGLVGVGDNRAPGRSGNADHPKRWLLCQLDPVEIPSKIIIGGFREDFMESRLFGNGGTTAEK
jgi:hypothetical protein